MANKFLFASEKNIPKINQKEIYLLYIFRQKNPYSFIALKALLMLNSINAKPTLTNTKIISLKFSQNQNHSKIYQKINFEELITIIPLFYTKPASIKKTMSSYLNEKKHFIFPGFVQHLKLPSWKNNVKLSFQGAQEKNYWLFFYKSAYFD